MISNICFKTKVIEYQKTLAEVSAILGYFSLDRLTDWVIEEHHFRKLYRNNGRIVSVPVLLEKFSDIFQLSSQTFHRILILFSFLETIYIFCIKG